MAKSVPMTARNISKLRRKARVEAFYQNAYETLRAVVDFKRYSSFSVSPKRGKIIRDISNTGTRRKPRYTALREPGYLFTPSQKSLLVRLATYKPTDEQLQREPAMRRVNRRIKSALFNAGDGVRNGAYTIVKLTDKQRAFFKLNPVNQITNKGLILKSQALKPKIVKLGLGYAITFTPPKKDGTAGRRREVYIPIPDRIYGHFSAIQAFMHRVNIISEASEFTLAVRTFHGKTTIKPKLFLRYVTELNESSGEAFGSENPFISGFYLITYKSTSTQQIIDNINKDGLIKDIIANPSWYDENDF